MVVVAAAAVVSQWWCVWREVDDGARAAVERSSFSCGRRFSGARRATARRRCPSARWRRCSRRYARLLTSYFCLLEPMKLFTHCLKVNGGRNDFEDGEGENSADELTRFEYLESLIEIAMMKCVEFSSPGDWGTPYSCFARYGAIKPDPASNLEMLLSSCVLPEIDGARCDTCSARVRRARGRARSAVDGAHSEVPAV